MKNQRIAGWVTTNNLIGIVLTTLGVTLLIWVLGGFTIGLAHGSNHQYIKLGDNCNSNMVINYHIEKYYAAQGKTVTNMLTQTVVMTNNSVTSTPSAAVPTASTSMDKVFPKDFTPDKEIQLQQTSCCQAIPVAIPAGKYYRFSFPPGLELRPPTIMAEYSDFLWEINGVGGAMQPGGKIHHYGYMNTSKSEIVIYFTLYKPHHHWWW